MIVHSYKLYLSLKLPPFLHAKNMDKLGKITGKGSSQSTKYGHEAAIGKYDKFAGDCRQKDPGFKLWIDTDIQTFTTQLIYQKFAFYLVNTAVKEVTVQFNTDGTVNEDEDGQPYAASTILQYFSNWVQAILLLDKDRDIEFFQQFHELKKGESPHYRIHKKHNEICVYNASN